MKTLRVSEDVVPIGEFKGKAARWFKRAAETGQPLLVTQNGKPAAVVLSPAEFDKLLEQQRFLREVAEGLADLESGKTFTTEQVRASLGLKRRRGRR